MMHYTCMNCGKPIRKPYPSKKYCGVSCRDASRTSRVEEQERVFWNSVRPLEVAPELQQQLSETPDGRRAGVLIEMHAPAGAVGYRVGCRRVGAESWNHTVHWFPISRERQPALFRLKPIEDPMDVPCPAEYIVAYFDDAGRLFQSALFKLFLRSRVVRLLWSDGDRRLLLDQRPR